MRHAASYGIVDRRLLFDRYLHRMSLEGMAIYLFLVLAADRDGRSYYRDTSIAGILRLSPSEIAAGRSELLAADLIDYRAPSWWVKNLSKPAHCPRLPLSRPSDLQTIRGAVPEALKELIRSLEGRP